MVHHWVRVPAKDLVETISSGWLLPLDRDRAGKKDFMLTWTFTALQEVMVYHILDKESGVMTISAYFSAHGSGRSEFLWA